MDSPSNIVEIIKEVSIGVEEESAREFWKNYFGCDSIKDLLAKDPQELDSIREQMESDFRIWDFLHRKLSPDTPKENLLEFGGGRWKKAKEKNTLKQPKFKLEFQWEIDSREKNKEPRGKGKRSWVDYSNPERDRTRDMT